MAGSTLTGGGAAPSSCPPGPSRRGSRGLPRRRKVSGRPEDGDGGGGGGVGRAPMAQPLCQGGPGCRPPRHGAQRGLSQLGARALGAFPVLSAPRFAVRPTGPNRAVAREGAQADRALEARRRERGGSRPSLIPHRPLRAPGQPGWPWPHEQDHYPGPREDQRRSEAGCAAGDLGGSAGRAVPAERGIGSGGSPARPRG